MISKDTRRTKIIWSFEAKVLGDDLAANIAQEDADTLRLVFNRETASNIARFIDTFRNTLKPGMRGPSIMLDLAEGPRANINPKGEAKDLAYGAKIKFGVIGSKAPIEITATNFTKLFRKDGTAFIGYGDVVLKCLDVSEASAEFEIMQGGVAYPDAEIHVPETRSPTSLLDFDNKALEDILKRNIDYVALPGISSVESVKEFRSYIQKHAKNSPWLILRVDSLPVYKNLEALIAEADGILVSRRELALSFNPATVPMLTKEIIQRCNDQAKLVLTASEMLGSMRRNVSPTRAEVSDIANAVIDGTDAVVLSEEVTHGKFADKALQVMRRIIADVEQRSGETPNWVKLAPTISTEFDAIAYEAYRTAQRVKSKAIVCITKSGNTALKLASFGPPVPIIAVTFDPFVLRRLALVRGVYGFVLDMDPKIDEVLHVVTDRLKRENWLHEGDKIVFVSITLSSVGREASNLLTVQTLA